jgi:hypothetical protein
VTLEEAFYTTATANAGISALIGTRLYPLLIPQTSALPAAAYQRVTSTRETAHDGSTNFVTATLQVSCQATSYASAKALAGAFISAFHGVRGTWGTVEVFRCTVNTELDSDEVEDAATTRVDLLVYYRES